MSKLRYVCIIVTLALLQVAQVASAAAADAQSVEQPIEPSARAAYYSSLSSWDEKAIDSMYEPSDLQSLSYYIRSLDTGKLSSFKQMVQLQVYLFNKFTNLGDYNDLYVFNVAYYFYQIQNHRYYNQLSSATRKKVNNSIQILPPSLLYLFFKPSFCLYNRKYLEYIYTTTAIEIDDLRRYIFVWNTPNSVGSNGRWVRQLRELPSSQELKLKFALKSEQVKMFLYLERSKQSILNLVAAWRPGSQPSHSEWSVQLYQNQLIFSQNGRIMCASDELYNSSRRYVYGYQNGSNNYSDMSPACQWYARQCP